MYKYTIIIILLIYSNIAYSGYTTNYNPDYSHPEDDEILSVNDLSYFNLDSLELFKKVKLLELGLFRSKSIPNSIKYLKNLNDLTISGNSNLRLEDLIVLLKDLKDLGYLSIVNFAKEFQTNLLDSLNTVRYADIPFIMKNGIIEIPIDIVKLKNLSSLNLIYCNIKHIPIELSYLSKLNSLNLSSNLLDTIPDYLSNFKELKILVLNSNKFKYLPIQLFNLKKLSILELEGNPQLDFKDLFVKINLFSKPIHLNLRNCDINILPKEVTECDKIEELDLCENHLKSIPIEVLKLKNLKSLDLHDNNLATIPDSIYLARNLEFLDLDNNNINNLPDYLKYCTKLKMVFLYNNPITVEEIERMEKLLPNTVFRYKIIKN